MFLFSIFFFFFLRIAGFLGFLVFFFGLIE
jgi:hypothetical protein